MGTMKNTMTTVLSWAAMIGLTLGMAAGAANALPALPALVQAAAGGQAAAPKQPQWKSREEYDDFQKIVAAKDPNQIIKAADAFLQKYPNSDFRDPADLAKMQANQQLGNSSQATAAARDALKANPEDLGALNYLSFAFPFLYKATDADKDAQLAEAEAKAKQGLDVLGKQSKPASMSEEQFDQQVKALRANFNDALGFVALQKKDYATAITALNAAKGDNPSDPYVFYRLGLSYLYSTPPDFDHAIWNLARASALGTAAKAADAPAIEKFYGQVYVGRHGSDAGQDDVEKQAAASVEPPADFKVELPPKHAPTGNAQLDAFYQIEDALRVGGDQAQKTWESMKGQAFGVAGWVDSVEKGTDPGTYVVHIDVTPESKAKPGSYDIELKDAQPGCKDLSAGDPVRFQGTLAAYTVTPSFVLTLDQGKINDDDLAAAAAGKKKPAKPVHHRAHPAQGL